MPSKLKRSNLTLPTDLQAMLEKDAILNRRPLANQIIWILDQYYLVRKKEAGLFKPEELSASSQEIPVFEQPSQRLPVQASKLHE